MESGDAATSGSSESTIQQECATVGEVVLRGRTEAETASTGYILQALGGRSGGFITLLEDEQYHSIVSSQILSRFSELDLESPVSTYSWRAATILSSASIQEAIESIRHHEAEVLIVTDSENRYVGSVTLARLLRPPVEWEPDSEVLGQVGGMATPFGVYLTNGNVSGGVSDWQLIVTGACFYAFTYLGMLGAVGFATMLPKHWLISAFLDQFGIVTLLSGFHLTNASRMHAAEHMVVHAIERKTPLTPQIVAKMPRVHPRCGTNIAVGVFLFLSVISFEWKHIGLSPSADVQIILAILVTLAFRVPLGNFAQKYLTTSPPTQKEIKAGISAAQELIRKQSNAPYHRRNVFRAILRSGILHLLAGSVLTYGTLQALSAIFRLNLPAL